ncbi:hypothetical protein CsSME_00032615 [Camellia sinensis var. sinensis]
MFISGGKVEEMEEFFSTPVAPVCETPNMAAIGCFWTTLGSVVYCFGDTRGSHKVKYWDLAEIQKGMEALSPGAWAEVFDASNNEWKPLKQPSFRVPSMYMFLLPMHNEKIIIVQ